jgi:serine/threonine-protein kinase
VTDLEPGDHQVRLEHEGHAPWESALHVTPGTVLELQPVALKSLGAEPVAAAKPAAVNAAPPANTRPRTGRTRSYAGPVVRAPDSQPEPEPRAPAGGGGGTGTLRINTRPWSKVFVDGRLIGNTPQMNIPLESGRHSVTLVNDDFGIRKTVKVEIRAGQIETQVLTLTE